MLWRVPGHAQDVKDTLLILTPYHRSFIQFRAPRTPHHVLEQHVLIQSHALLAGQQSHVAVKDIVSGEVEKRRPHLPCGGAVPFGSVAMRKRSEGKLQKSSAERDKWRRAWAVSTLTCGTPMLVTERYIGNVDYLSAAKISQVCFICLPCAPPDFESEHESVTAPVQSFANYTLSPTLRLFVCRLLVTFPVKTLYSLFQHQCSGSLQFLIRLSLPTHFLYQNPNPTWHLDIPKQPSPAIS